MTQVESFIDQSDKRIQVVKPGTVTATDSACVLLWVQRSQRASGNHAANLAISIANELSLPVVAVFCLVDAYPGATLRAYHFMAEGLQELPARFAARNIGWVLRQGDPVEIIPKLASELKAVAVVSDVAPTRLARQWKADVAERISVPMVLVDNDVVVPTAHLTKLEWAPRTIRTKLLPLLDVYIHPIPNPKAQIKSNILESPDVMNLIYRMNLDRTVWPSPRFTGGQPAARKRLTWFVENHLASYDVDRNRSDIDGSSGMSPYLHFGQIGPVEIAHVVQEALAGKEGAALESFFNELIVQRELAINFAMYEPNYDRFDGIPDWAKKSLDSHREDSRPVLYDRESLESGQTHDRLWNAAQLQMVNEGFMPNRLRMYWAKQMLYWTPTQEIAFDLAVQLNDRYFVDGRDPNGYAGVAWAIGGRHDRPFPPNKPILGLVRPLGIKAMKRYFDVEAYIARIEEKYGST